MRQRFGVKPRGGSVRPALKSCGTGKLSTRFQEHRCQTSDNKTLASRKRRRGGELQTYQRVHDVHKQG